MTVRYLYIFILIFISNLGIAQDSYSSEVLENFVEVYMTNKIERKRNSEFDKELFVAYEVSNQRYREIAKAALNNEALSLKSNEEELIEEIKKQNDLLNIKNKELLNKLCLEHDIPIDLYTTILEGYNRNIKFQRSLKPYFDAYLKRLK